MTGLMALVMLALRVMMVMSDCDVRGRFKVAAVVGYPSTV